MISGTSIHPNSTITAGAIMMRAAVREDLVAIGCSFPDSAPDNAGCALVQAEVKLKWYGVRGRPKPPPNFDHKA